MFPCMHDVIVENHISTLTVLSTLVLLIRSTIDVMYDRCFFPLTLFIVVFAVKVAVVMSRNNLLKLEA